MAASLPVNGSARQSMEINGLNCSSMDFSCFKGEVYESLKRCVLATGKGRPPNPPIVNLDHRLLIQLCLIRDETDAGFIDVHSWMHRLFPSLVVAPTKFKNDLQNVWHHVCGQSIDELTSYCNLPYRPNLICDELQSIGIDRNVLLQSSPVTFKIPHTLIPKMSTVVHLNSYRNYHGHPQSFISEWLCIISGADKRIVNSNLKTMLRKYKIIQKEKQKNPEKFSNFMSSPFIVPPSPTIIVSPSPVPETVSPTPTSTDNTTQTDVKIFKVKATQMKQHTFHTIATQTDPTSHRNKLTQMKGVISTLEQQCKALKERRQYLDNLDLRKTLLEQEQLISTLSQDLKKLADNAHFAKQEKQSLQKTISRLKTEKNSIQEQLISTKQKLETLNAIVLDESAVSTRKDGPCNQFTDDVRLAIYGLVGAGVAATKCPRVIDIVARSLFDTILDLPHPSTACKLMDDAAAINKIHIAERLQETQHATLHSDGTSRDKKKYVGQQITLDDGTVMSLGFSEVATEDSASLLEVTTSALDDLCDVVDDINPDVFFKMLLRKLCSTMSDRASVMKSFNSKFHEFRCSVLGEEVRTNFLYCNAHFLLGLSTACEQALKLVEKEVVEKDGVELGRDSSSSFKGWGGDEGATVRYVRTASSCLGPRCDEKSGVREEWLAFCSKEDINIKLTSYRSNRFNNLFENSKCLYLLRNDITTFLSSNTSATNRKIQSVLLDCKDDRVHTFLSCVALLCIYITSPYWKLVNSNTKYCDFYKYVQLFETNIKRWLENPRLLLDEGCRDVFDVAVSVDISVFIPDNHDLSESILRHCLQKMLEVTQRQLADFLVGGFSGEVDSSVKLEIEACPLTNLTGEHAFGDLDFDIATRRNSSLFNRGIKHMLKRNKTMDWLARKGDIERRRILEKGKTLGKTLKRKFKAQEEVVKLKIKEKLVENERRQHEKEVKLANEKKEILERVMKDGGVCKTKGDVERLVTVESLKAQLRYHKIVIGRKDVLIGGTKEVLVDRLVLFLDGTLESDCPSPPCKRPRMAESSSEDEVDGESDGDETDVGDEPVAEFKFTTQGTWVAVYYDESLYIGQVLNVLSPDSSIVKFMRETRCSGTFKWPPTEDVAEVNSKFVFRWDFEVAPVSSNFRIWNVPMFCAIKKAYGRLCQS